MIKRIAGLVFSIVFALPLLGQTTSVTTQQALSGLEEPIQKVGKFLLVGPKSIPIVKPVGLIVVEPQDPAKPIVNVVVQAAEIVAGTWSVVQVPQEEPGRFIIERQGHWLVIISGENVRPPTLFPLTIGPPLPPPEVLGCMDSKALNYNPQATKDDGTCRYPVPPPSPVPPDQFDNIGQRVAQWAVGLPKRKEIAAVYRGAAYQLVNPPPTPVPPGYPITINEIATALGSAKGSVLGIETIKWKPLTDSINADTSGRWPMARQTLADYWECVAKGLEAGQ